MDIVFAPSVDEVYPPGFDTRVSVGAIAGPLEGVARPGHFDGVATVVAILFALVGAERAYFGLKDYQQVRVIRRMALDLALPTEVVPCETVREPDGLAMSSRNARLSPAGRAAAPVLRRALLEGSARIHAGERRGDAVRAAMHEILASEPLADPDYVSVADADTLAELDVDRRRDAPLARRPDRGRAPHRQRASGRGARAVTPESFFEGHPLGLAAHARVLEIVSALGAVDVRVTKTQVAYRRRRGFAYLWLPGTWLRNPAAEVVLSIALPREDGSARWKQVAHPSDRIWMHHLELHEMSEIDEDVAGWLAEAREAAA